MKLTNNHIEYWRDLLTSRYFLEILEYITSEHAYNFDGETEHPHLQAERYGRSKGFHSFLRAIKTPAPPESQSTESDDGSVSYDMDIQFNQAH